MYDKDAKDHKFEVSDCDTDDIHAGIGDWKVMETSQTYHGPFRVLSVSQSS
jgi:hypothetical protein